MTFYKLKNGIKVVIQEVDTDLTSISYFIKQGTIHETEKELDYTHLIEHILASYTSKKNCDYKDIDNDLGNYILDSNAMTTQYYTKVWIKGYFSDIEKYLDLLGNSLLNICFSEEKLQIEKKAVIQELRQKLKYMHFYEQIEKKIYGRIINNYSQSIKVISKVNSNQLLKYYNEKMKRKEIIIGIVCPKNKTNETKQIVKKYFSSKLKTLKKKEQLPIIKLTNDIVFIKNKEHKTNNCKLETYIDLKNIELNSAEHIISKIWLQNLITLRSGELYKILRKELKIIYSINGFVDIDNENIKNSCINLTTNTNTKNVKVLIENIKKIIKTTTISENEFDISKKQLLYSSKKTVDFPSLSTEINFKLKPYIYNKQILTLEQYIEKIKILHILILFNLLKLFKLKLLCFSIIVIIK